MNSILVSLYSRAYLYADEVVTKKNSYGNIFNGIVVAVVGVCGFAFVCIYYAYIAIIKKKEGYLEVFFEIGDDVIEKSLKQCDEYSKKIHKEVVYADDDENIDEDDFNPKKDEEKKEDKKEEEKKEEKNKKEEDEEDEDDDDKNGGVKLHSTIYLIRTWRTK